MWDLGPGADSYWSLFAVEPQAKHSYGHVTSKNPDEKEGQHGSHVLGGEWSSTPPGYVMLARVYLQTQSSHEEHADHQVGRCLAGSSLSQVIHRSSLAAVVSPRLASCYVRPSLDCTLRASVFS